MCPWLWVANGVRSASHRRVLLKYAGKHGLYRDPERLVERMAQLEDGLWRAVGIAEIETGLLVGRYPKVIYCDLDSFLIER